jgi:hypothetical protein
VKSSILSSSSATVRRDRNCPFVGRGLFATTDECLSPRSVRWVACLTVGTEPRQWV